MKNYCVCRRLPVIVQTMQLKTVEIARSLGIDHKIFIKFSKLGKVGVTVACIVRDYYSGTERLSVKSFWVTFKRKSDWFLANVIELKKKIDNRKKTRSYEFNRRGNVDELPRFFYMLWYDLVISPQARVMKSSHISTQYAVTLPMAKSNSEGSLDSGMCRKVRLYFWGYSWRRKWYKLYGSMHITISRIQFGYIEGSVSFPPSY